MRDRCRAVPPVLREVRQDHFCPSGLLPVTEGQQCVPRLGRLFAPRSFCIGPTLGEAQQQGGTAVVVRGPEVERLPVETRGRAEGGERKGAFTCVAEREACTVRDQVFVDARGTCELERTSVVVSE